MTEQDAPAGPEQQPIINIVGEKVALGPLRGDLIPLYQKWSNDFDVTRYYGRMRPTSQEVGEEWYQSLNKNERAAYFTIYQKVDMRPVGDAGLFDIHKFHRTAEFDVFIGRTEC